MICASVNRDYFIVRLPAWTDSTKKWRRFRGSGHVGATISSSSANSALDATSPNSRIRFQRNARERLHKRLVRSMRP